MLKLTVSICACVGCEREGKNSSATVFGPAVAIVI